MVRNGHNVSICIWYEMVKMYRSAYGTKWLWYEMAMVRNGYDTKMIFIMVRNDCNSFYLVEETGGSGENHRPVASH